MACSINPFIEYWRRQRERGALLRTVDELKLDPSKLRQLQGSSRVQAELQNTRMASLLPSVGTEIFRRFTAASLVESQANVSASHVEGKKCLKPALHLEAGKPLPFVYGTLPSQLVNAALEELDPFYQSQKTFIVLDKENIIHRFNAESSCYLLSPFSPVRSIAIRILLNSWFRLFILLTILADSFFHGPAQYVFTAIYTFEVVVKVASRGFCVNRFTFLRDPWNWLDLMVVILGFLQLLSHFVNLEKASFLLIVVLSLKLIAVYPGMRKTAGALIQSVKKLAGVFILTVCGLSILALIALHLFMGILRQKCTMWSYPSNNTDIHFTFVESHIKNPVTHYYQYDHEDVLLCGNGTQAGVCPEGYVCLMAGNNPNYGFTSFDSFGWSLLSLFRLMTQDYWENLFQMVLRAGGKTYMILFALIFLPGCFCLISLILAAAIDVFVDQDMADITEAKQKEEEFLHILEVIKREEEEQTTGGTENLNRKSQEHIKDSEQNQSWCSTCWHAFAERVLKWNCCGCWQRLKQLLQAFVMNPFFDFGILICIILNTIIMALNHYPMTEAFEEIVLLTELVFTLVFTVEMILRLLATDPYTYFKVGWNIFDFIIISGAIMDIYVHTGEVFHLLRVFRLGRWWPMFNLWIKILWASVRAQRNLTLILCIVVFNSSVIGLQLFGEDYENNIHQIAYDNQLPRWHMNDFFHSFMLVVRMLCGEWIETLWDCMAVSSQATCLIFYFTVLFLGNLLVLNLFLALLLSSFCGDYLVPAERGKNNIKIAINHIKTALGIRTCRDAKVDSNENKEGLGLIVVPEDQSTTSSRAPIAEAELDFQTSKDDGEKQQSDIGQNRSEIQQNKDDKDDKSNTPEACCCDGCYRCCPFLNKDTSRGRGKVWSKFRTACLFLTDHKCFEILIIFLILLSSIALVFEDIHLQHNPDMMAALDKADQVFAYLFLLEMVIKWIALGLKKYFSSFWCWLDFVILTVSLVTITAGMLGCTELGAGLSLRTLRALRPLRVLSRFEGPKVVLEALANILRSMLSVLLVIAVVWLFFNLIGVNIFAGSFSYCYNETTGEIMLTSVVNNKTQCISLYEENYTELRWKNPYINFDNVGIGYLALLQLATFKGWLDIMYSVVDSRWVEDQPEYEVNIYLYLYVILFIFFGCFVTFNLFFRVFTDKLDLQRPKFGGKYFFMTEKQRKYSRTMARLFSKTPVISGPRPQNQCQARLFDLVTNPFFEAFMVVLTCLNMVTLMVDTHQQGYWKGNILYWLHCTFVVIYFIEFLLMIISLRKYYFASGWNILDFMVVVASFLGLFIAELAEKYFIPPALFPVFRLAHICRILHLFPCTRRIRKLLLAFVMSLPALFNICFLLFVLMFTYSIFGMLNFPFVKKDAMLDDMLNFETFANSFICMFVMTTRAGWDGVLHPFLKKEPDCDPDIENPGSTISGNCASPEVGIIFCTSFVLLSLLLVVQLYIAVILETFNTGETEEPSDDDLKMFCKTWKEFDPFASQVIQNSQLSDLCDSLQDPLRIPKPNSYKLAQIDLPLLPGDKVNCLDVLMALTAQAFGEPGERDALKARMEEILRTNFYPRQNLGDVEETAAEAPGDTSVV